MAPYSIGSAHYIGKRVPFQPHPYDLLKTVHGCNIQKGKFLGTVIYIYIHTHTHVILYIFSQFLFFRMVFLWTSYLIKPTKPVSHWPKVNICKVSIITDSEQCQIVWFLLADLKIARQSSIVFMGGEDQQIAQSEKRLECNLRVCSSALCATS